MPLHHAGLLRGLKIATVGVLLVRVAAVAQQTDSPYTAYRSNGLPHRRPEKSESSGTRRRTIDRQPTGWKPRSSAVTQSVYVAQEDPGKVIQSAHQSPEIPQIPNPTPAEVDPLRTYADPDRSFPPYQEQPPFVSPRNSTFKATWLAGDGDDIGMSDFDIRSTLAFSRPMGLTLTPGFQMHFLDGPTRTDLPPRLYNARVEFGWKQQLSPVWGYQLAVAPGIYSDFDNTGSDAIRIIGRALAFYAYAPTTQLVFGVIYLDREDISVLPVLGVIHVPNENVRLDIVFPKPKLAYRFGRGEGVSYTGYIAGEFGGGSWAVERVSGADDVVSISDWRLILGIETTYDNGPSFLLEAAYVFNRELEYKSGIGDFDPDDTAMLRCGVTF